MNKTQITDGVTPIGVDDPNFACAYYACVFDAELEIGGDEDKRHIIIGSRRYDIVQARAVPAEDAGFVAPVRDVDLSIAKAATKGARILSRAADGPGGVREGRIADPFGYSWRVASA